MKKGLFLLLVGYSLTSFAAKPESCQTGPKWLQASCKRLQQIWYQGNTDLYFSGYAWHNRYTYSKARIARFNELAWGGGLGKGFYDEKANWHGLYAVAFLDSHKKVEPALGYAYLKMAHFSKQAELGAGLSLIVTSRSDMYHRLPFAGVLPWVTASMQPLTIAATYIPGAQGAGNVLYILGKWKLG